MPIVKINLGYSQIDEVTKAPHYIKHIPQVHVDHPTFDFGDNDFELRVKDKSYLKDLDISEKDFERCIDCFEKIAHMYNKEPHPTAQLNAAS